MSLRRLPFCATIAIGLGLFPTAQAQGSRVTDATLAGYYAVYQNPFVIGLRKELDAYIALKQGKSEKWHGRGRTDKAMLERADLEQVDSQYLSSRFTVYKIEGQPFTGGRQVSILFIEKPDRIFKAWMYLTGDGIYELRGFKDSGITPEQIAVMRKSYEKLMLDREHAL
ncbi:hypothetical protein SRABI118_01399 [Massilia sp. Bi118]|uniref:hypothetical protein n=1 Tax=Massilia sp. Bi118 TaxID=2822346 RepID=UPI001D663D85|nr:hypothetical protein [Massilia sp. Bi118]CAH0187189.1 hypothetical protein SRABI118_01399 [Massilia sp. Bi118]